MRGNTVSALHIRGNAVLHIRHQIFARDFSWQNKINGFHLADVGRANWGYNSTRVDKNLAGKEFFQGS